MNLFHSPPHPIHSHFAILVAGAGIGGISAALAAARLQQRVLLLEAAPEIGGTGVHSPVALVCNYFDHSGRFINRGLHREYFPYLYEPGALDLCQTYDERELKETYDRLVQAEPFLTLLTSASVSSVQTGAGRLLSVELQDGRRFSADFFIDSTADGNLAALAGAAFQKGRAADGKLQPATLTFRVDGVDFRAFGMNPERPDWLRWDQIHLIKDGLQPYYDRLRESGSTSNPRENVLCFADRRGTSLLFNQTRIGGVDPTDPESVAAGEREGRKQIEEFWNAVRQHPAFAKVSSMHISSKLGVREGRRIIGDYLLTAEDCLGEARFDDMVAACAYPLDIHDPDGTGKTRIEKIPGSGYYHIPYRSLISSSFSNLLMGSRCISGSHEAHSSYRVMAPISAIGQAAGTAAALASGLKTNDVREVGPEWIRHTLMQADQFTEGAVACPPDLQTVAVATLS